jgi:integrase
MIQRYLIPVFGELPLLQIKAPEINAFLNKLRDNLAESTVRHAYSTLRQALDTAVGWRYLVYNPCAGVEKPKVKQTQKPALTVAQVQSLFTVVKGHPTAPLFHVMGTLGTRLGETLALRRTDFSSDFTEVQIATQISYHSHKRTAPKDDSARPLPVPPRLSAYLAAHWSLVCAQQKDAAPNFKNQGLMFPSEAGTPFQSSNVEKVWNGYTQRRMTKKGMREYVHKGLREKAGLPDWATIHSLRGFVATTLEDVDTEQRTTGHILGHGAKNVTERYIKKRIPTMRRALERLEAVLWAEREEQEMTG